MAEGAGLENRYTRKGIEGSNPSLSVSFPSVPDTLAALAARAEPRVYSRTRKGIEGSDPSLSVLPIA